MEYYDCLSLAKELLQNEEKVNLVLKVAAEKSDVKMFHSSKRVLRQHVVRQ
jgi:hypothetical protein